ncbi:MAG: type II toxin-antitoxin system HicA family toxin [bacterium]
MPRIFPVSYQDFERFLLYAGCRFDRQKGSHRIYKRSDLSRPIVVPAREVPVFIIKNNLKLLGISPAQYLEILKIL